MTGTSLPVAGQATLRALLALAAAPAPPGVRRRHRGSRRRRRRGARRPDHPGRPRREPRDRALGDPHRPRGRDLPGRAGVQTVFTRMTRLRAGVLGEEVLADLREDFLDARRDAAHRGGRARRHRRPRVAHDHRRRPPQPCGARRGAGDHDRVRHRAVRGRRLVVTAPQLALAWLLAVPPILISSRWYFRRAPQSLPRRVGDVRGRQRLDRRDRRRRADGRALPPRHAAHRTSPTRGSAGGSRGSGTRSGCARSGSRSIEAGVRAPARRRPRLRRLAGRPGHDLARPADHRPALHADARRAGRPDPHVVRRAAGRARRRSPASSACSEVPDAETDADLVPPTTGSWSTTSASATAPAATCCTASTSTSRPASGSRWWGRRARASRPSAG